MGNKNMESVLFSTYHFDPKKILCNYLGHPLQDMVEVVDKDLTFNLELLIDLYWKYHYPSDTSLVYESDDLSSLFFVSDDLSSLLFCE